MSFANSTNANEEHCAYTPLHRDTPTSRAARAGFDTKRPTWLNDPRFTAEEITAASLAATGAAGLDVNRPELGADFDEPDYGPRTDQGNHVDDIDEPFDHRVGMDRHHTTAGPAPHRSRRPVTGRSLTRVMAAAGDTGPIPAHLVEELLLHVERLQQQMSAPYLKTTQRTTQPTAGRPRH